MKKIAFTKLDDLFAALSQNQDLFLPVDDNAGQASYTRWEPGMELSRKCNTVRSAKDLFFPQVENLAGFRVEGKKLEILNDVKTPGPFVLFGVRACDLRSFDILDRVFLAEPADSYYRDRRNACTVITMACGAPLETCFCTAFGIDPADPQGDVTCWWGEDFLYWRANTEKGQALTGALPMLEEGDDASVAALREKIRAVMERLPFGKLDLSAFGAGKTEALFKRPEWKELSESCLGCGTCTFLCPTCQCYDIQEFNTGKSVRRFRCWDSCMYSDFTKMSAGQPRPTQLERFRQRFMHKLVYYPENNEGIFSCVGCGRCLARCPIHMNIVKVIKVLGGATDEN